MAKLKRDERVCPYCAETIKKAATRCRFCQSDVIPVATAEPETPPEPRTAPDPVVEGSSVAPRRSLPSVETVQSFLRQGLQMQMRLTAVLAGLVLIAAVLFGVAWWRAEHGVSATAPDGSLVSDDARTQVLVAAADLTKRTLSYDYKTLPQDMEQARARMTPTFRKEYDATMKQVRANTEKNKIVLEAVAVSSAIISGTEHRAKVLVFVNQTTTAGTGKSRNEQLNRNSLVVTLTRGEGDWDMHKLTALG